MTNVNVMAILWGLAWLVFHIAAKPLSFDVDFVGCVAFSLMMAELVNKLQASDE